MADLDKEFRMFEVSKKASELIEEFLQEQQKSQPIRLLMTEGGGKAHIL